MKTQLSVILGLPMVLLSSALFAQTTTPGSPARTTPAPSSTTTYDSPTSSYDAVVENRDSGYGFAAGAHEFTLAGTGFSNEDMDSSSGGVTASYGVYLNEAVLVSLRQSANYVNPDGGDSGWAGTTAAAIDLHFGDARLRPLIGASVGYSYGDQIDESFFAGLEGGLKFYVQPRTFLFALAEYVWSFEDTDDADDTFDDGGFRWTVGIGFNF